MATVYSNYQVFFFYKKQAQNFQTQKHNMVTQIVIPLT